MMAVLQGAEQTTAFCHLGQGIRKPTVVICHHRGSGNTEEKHKTLAGHAFEKIYSTPFFCRLQEHGDRLWHINLAAIYTRLPQLITRQQVLLPSLTAAGSEVP